MRVSSKCRAQLPWSLYHAFIVQGNGKGLTLGSPH